MKKSTTGADGDIVIDYRCEDRRKAGELRDDIGAIRYFLTPSLRNRDSYTKKSEPFSQEMHFKILTLSRDFENVSLVNQVVKSISSLLRGIGNTNGFLALSSFR